MTKTRYQVHETFLTLQGEGYWAGRAAVFCRFSRCNLWTGREKDRHRAVCQFCDTNFVDGHPYDLPRLADTIQKTWEPGPTPGTTPMVVFTGGEPLLQLDEALTSAMHTRGFYIAVETNGTQPRPAGIDWLCMSPKAKTDLAITRGDELKLVYPQAGINPANMLGLNFTHHWLSPMNDPAGGLDQANTYAAIQYILAHPQWRLSLQTHKITGMP